MQYVWSMHEKCVDGILMNSVAALNTEQQTQLAGCGVPVVLLNRSASSRMFSTVCADNEAGGMLAAQYLLELGHRKIAHITGPQHHGNLSDRTRGFLHALRSAKTSVRPVVLRGDLHFNGGMELTRKLLEKHPDVTAIFAANDVMAFGATQFALKRGFRIPEDHSLVGFNNIEFSSIIHPAAYYHSSAQIRNGSGGSRDFAAIGAR